MPSFDVVSQANMVEVRNAVDQANREIGTRFDFKGSDSRLELAELELTAHAGSDFQIQQIRDILINKLAKRSVDVRFMDMGKVEPVGGDRFKQVIHVRKGIDAELAKRIVRLVKDSRVKVQASIQSDMVRVSGAKRDDLQSTMALLRKSVTEIPLQFNNLRD